ncbi:hypothetical protein BDN72DRAFT_496729 [Pluteus cervinus]|uniref:Uncharacterized protein n=1 Tax=Pluteus cervinus TaxID=181527 RepID=A0ACD3B143_9AGAR|nr:hypothetical protein BDN72DRAFT_496729 [Pluteus cervinus]
MPILLRNSEGPEDDHHSFSWPYHVSLIIAWRCFVPSSKPRFLRKEVNMDEGTDRTTTVVHQI